jgi:tetratricopeptide (TPR) repeat protein
MPRWLRTPRTALSLAFRAPAAAVGRFRHWPWKVRLLAGVALLLPPPALGYALWVKHRESQRRSEVSRAWDEFGYRAAHLNGPEVRDVLERLRALDPANPTVGRRLDALAAGEADAHDEPLLRLLTSEHFAAGRVAEAAREARKLVACQPADWRGRAVLCFDAIRRGDRAAARAELDALPPPLESRTPIDPASALLVLRLRGGLGLGDGGLLELMALRVLPFLKTDQAGQCRPGEKLIFLECYGRTFPLLPTHPELPGYWVAAARLAQSVIDDPAATTAELVQLGMLQEGHLALVGPMRQAGKFGDAEAGELVRELEGRIAQTWAKAQQGDSSAAVAYVGRALARMRTGDLAAALDALEEGLRHCPDQAELLAVQGRLLRVADPALGLARVEEAAARRPDELPVWQLLAESALAAGRLDKALSACQQARRLRPGLAWACLLEARLRLDQGRPADALDALAPLRPTFAQNGVALGLQVRALWGAGRGAEAAALVDEAGRADRPAAVLLGGAAGLLAAGQYEPAAREAAAVVGREPALAEGWWVKAEALRQLADAGSDDLAVRRWRREAAEAYEQVLHRQPGHGGAVRQLVWLYAKGLGDPSAAYRAAVPLRDLEAQGALPPDLMETLAVAYLGVDQAEPARRLLEAAERWAAQRPDGDTRTGDWASCALHLAQAYQKLARGPEAQAAFDRASSLPKTPRVAADWLATQRLLRGGLP